MDRHDAPHLPGRRAVARGAAWSAPVIALAIAAPRAAASTTAASELVITGPDTAASPGGDDGLSYEYSVTALDVNLQPTQCPAGSRLVCPASFHVTRVSGGSWDATTNVLTLAEGSGGSVAGPFVTVGVVEFATYLPGHTTASHTLTVTVIPT